MAETLYKFGEFDVTKSVFARSDHCIAIYNISPILPGHSLVLPIEPVISLFDLRSELVAEFFQFSIRVTEFLVEVFEGTGFDWTIQDGWDAGQTVPHMHLHVMPRRQGDFSEPGDWYPAFERSQSQKIDTADRVKLAPDEVQRIAAYLRLQWRTLGQESFRHSLP